VSKTLDAIRQLSWVAEVDDEREAGSSIIVTLREGYEFACNAGCGVQGFDTVGAARAGTARSAVLELAVHTAVDHVETKRACPAYLARNRFWKSWSGSERSGTDMRCCERIARGTTCAIPGICLIGSDMTSR
jgi:hypothetical protein